MTDTKEALRLAEWLDRCAESIEQINAAAMLRTLAAEAQALRADAERLDWLDTQGELGGYPGDAMPSWKTWQVQFPASHVRFAIDREREREAQARAALQGESK